MSDAESDHEEAEEIEPENKSGCVWLAVGCFHWISRSSSFREWRRRRRRRRKIWAWRRRSRRRGVYPAWIALSDEKRKTLASSLGPRRSTIDRRNHRSITLITGQNRKWSSTRLYSDGSIQSVGHRCLSSLQIQTDLFVVQESNRD